MKNNTNTLCSNICGKITSILGGLVKSTQFKKTTRLIVLTDPYDFYDEGDTIRIHFHTLQDYTAIKDYMKTHQDGDLNKNRLIKADMETMTMIFRIRPTRRTIK